MHAFCVCLIFSVQTGQTTTLESCSMAAGLHDSECHQKLLCDARKIVFGSCICIPHDVCVVDLMIRDETSCRSILLWPVLWNSQTPYLWISGWVTWPNAFVLHYIFWWGIHKTTTFSGNGGERRVKKVLLIAEMYFSVWHVICSVCYLTPHTTHKCVNYLSFIVLIFAWLGCMRCVWFTTSSGSCRDVWGMFLFRPTVLKRSKLLLLDRRSKSYNCVENEQEAQNVSTV